VTAMMAFFMVMWITAQKNEMKQAVQRYFNDPFNALSKSKGPLSAGSLTTGPKEPGSTTILPSRHPGDPPGIKRPKDVPKPIGRKIEDVGPKPWAGEGKKSGGINKPTLFRRNDGDQQGMGTIVSFAENSGELDVKAAEQLKRIIPLLLGKRQKIEIRGHARQHSTPGGEADVWQLSYVRCTATMKFLVELGVEPDRFRLSQAGANEPRTISDGTENQTLNSCVDVIVLPELTDDFFGSRAERATLDCGP